MSRVWPLMQTAKEVNPHPRIMPCITQYVECLLLLLMLMLMPLVELLVHEFAWEGQVGVRNW